MSNERCRPLAVHHNPLGDNIAAIIFSLYKLIPGDVVFTSNFRRIELDMVDPPRSWVYSSPTHAPDDLFIDDDDFDHVVDADTLAVERLGLPERSRKTVEQKPGAAIGFCQTPLDQFNDNPVRHQFSGGNDFLRAHPHRGASAHRFAQHVAG